MQIVQAYRKITNLKEEQHGLQTCSTDSSRRLPRSILSRKILCAICVCGQSGVARGSGQEVRPKKSNLQVTGKGIDAVKIITTRHHVNKVAFSPNIEPFVYRAVFLVVFVTNSTRCETFLRCFRLCRRAVLISSTYINTIQASLSAIACVDIGAKDATYFSKKQVQW